MKQPKLEIVEEQSEEVNLLALTPWEQRRKMNATQLIEIMGKLHVDHPQYKRRKIDNFPIVPNLAGRQPVLSYTDYRLIIGDVKRLLQCLQ